MNRPLRNRPCPFPGKDKGAHLCLLDLLIITIKHESNEIRKIPAISFLRFLNLNNNGSYLFVSDRRTLPIGNF